MPFNPKRLLVAASVLAVAMASGAGMAVASDGASPAVGATFVPLDEVVVPIVGSDRIEGTLRLRMVIETKDSAVAEELASRLRELRAATLAAAVEHSRLYASALAPVNVEQLGGDMNLALKQANPSVGRVLVTEVGAFAI